MLSGLGIWIWDVGFWGFGSVGGTGVGCWGWVEGKEEFPPRFSQASCCCFAVVITQNQTILIPHLNHQPILPSIPCFPLSFDYFPHPLLLKHFPTTSCSSLLLHTIASSHVCMMEWKRWRQQFTCKTGAQGWPVPPLSLGHICWAYVVGSVGVGVGSLDIRLAKLVGIRRQWEGVSGWGRQWTVCGRWWSMSHLKSCIKGVMTSWRCDGSLGD